MAERAGTFPRVEDAFRISWSGHHLEGYSRRGLILCQVEVAVWLVEAAGAVVGIVMATEEADPQYRHASIDIALAAAGRGHGLGPAAVRTVARWLIDVRGHHRLTIDPSTANERAIAAYAKVGFRPVGTMRAYERWRDGTWHDGLLMDLVAAELG